VERIANITQRGASRRRRQGVAWLIVSVVLASILFYLGLPRGMRLLLAIPIGLSAVGFLQAREKT